MTRVLLVEDDAERMRSISAELVEHGFALTCVTTGAEAIVGQRTADVVVLNLDLPDLDGTVVCRRIRAASSVPMIGVLENSTALDRVLALRAGLDVCMSAASHTRELVARIETMMRRRRPREHGPAVLSGGDLEIDGLTRQVRLAGKVVGLTRKEFALLHLLASRPGVTVGRGQILAEVWDDDNTWMLRSRTMDTHVNNIRRKLGASAVIHTERGVGFRFGWPGPDRGADRRRDQLTGHDGHDRRRSG
jgi:DNA-binding response OmpR family regulator